jgi:hypothetical protein
MNVAAVAVARGGSFPREIECFANCAGAENVECLSLVAGHCCRSADGVERGALTVKLLQQVVSAAKQFGRQA